MTDGAVRISAAPADFVDGAAQEEDPQQPVAESRPLNAKTTAAAAGDGGVLSAKASGRGVESAAESGDESDDAGAGRSNAGSDDGVKASCHCAIVRASVVHSRMFMSCHLSLAAVTAAAIMLDVSHRGCMQPGRPHTALPVPTAHK